ncbi:MAG: hypothetical protein WBF04_07020 [Candidatus Sulfotelmatobacter sp.]
MGESEARTVTIHGSAAPPDPKAEARKKRELDALTVRVFGEPTTSTPKKRQHNPTTERLYSRIREIPRNVPLKEFCKRCDSAQITFRIPKYLRDEGCPETWFAAWQDASKWRGRIHDLRQNAWRNVPRKPV